MWLSRNVLALQAQSPKFSPSPLREISSPVFRRHPTECSPYFQQRHWHQSCYICNHQHSSFPAFSIIRKTAGTPVPLLTVYTEIGSDLQVPEGNGNSPYCFRRLLYSSNHQHEERFPKPSTGISVRKSMAYKTVCYPIPFLNNLNVMYLSLW